MSPGHLIEGAQRLVIEHETRYSYSPMVETAHHLAFLQPVSDGAQALEQFDLSIDPPPAHRVTRRDAMGNARTSFELMAMHAQLSVVARSQVLVRDRFGGVRTSAGLTCGQVRERLAYRVGVPFEPACRFVHASPLVPLRSALRNYAAPILHDDRPVAEAAVALMKRIHADFAYVAGATDVSTSIIDVMERRQGVCQDFAHVMLGCLRACGLPARYVSGYVLTRAGAGDAPMLGADASHAWVSVWCPGIDQPLANDWLDLDPTNNCVPATHHVRVAHGRDFGDVTPLRGVIRGGARHTLMVRVTTRLVG